MADVLTSGEPGKIEAEHDGVKCVDPLKMKSSYFIINYFYENISYKI